MEKIKHKFNVMDIVIILAVALVIFALLKVYIIDKRGDAGGETVTLQYVIQTDMISEELAGNVSAGDIVYDAETGRVIGEVAACDARNATHVGVSGNGSQIVSDIAGYKSLQITVVTEAEGGAKGYFANSVLISVGLDYRMMLPNLYCTGSCISAEIIG